MIHRQLLTRIVCELAARTGFRLDGGVSRRSLRCGRADADLGLLSSSIGAVSGCLVCNWPSQPAISSLGITQMLAWASTYYLTAVFTDPVSTSLGLSRTWFYGSVSAALLLSGLLGPVAGRVIDRYGGRDVLAATNVVSAAGLLLLALARARHWDGIWPL